MDERAYVDELTNILLKTGALDPDDAKGLAETFEQSRHETFDAFLLEESFVDKEGLLKALSILYKVPSIDVDGYFFETFLLRKFPKDFLLRNAIIPYEQDENMLIMIAADPSDESLLDTIGAQVSYDIQFNVGIYTDILDAIKEYYDTSVSQVSEDPERNLLDAQKAKQIEELDDISGQQERRSYDDVIDQQIKQFVHDETEDEHKQIEENAHNVHKKR